MAEKKTEPKMTLEREYIVPLRKKFLRTPKYKRVPKAVKALRQFIARNMKIEDRDLKKVKIDKWLNSELWFRGIKNPLHKIKVKAKKFDDGNVFVELIEIPEVIKFKKQKEEKAKVEADKKKAEKKVEEEARKKAEEEAKKKEEESKEGKEKKAEEEKKEEDKEEKQEAVKEAGKVQAEKKHKELIHKAAGKIKQPKHQMRKALEK